MMEVLGLLLLVAIGWFWLDGVRARDAAVLAARRFCEPRGYQFLDDTVATTRVRPERDDDGVLRLCRVYRFEYSDTGNNRQPASIVLLGQRVVGLNAGLRVVSEPPSSEPPSLH